MGEWQVVGHRRAIRMLQGSIRYGRIAHAYVLTGPARCGKATLAREFAKVLNCEGKEAPCQVCPSCRRIGAGEDFDVTEIGVQSGKHRIQIDQIREFHRRSTLTAAGSRYKMAIVTRAELMSEGAANAFLKTLEEPPSRTVMVLATPRLDLLPATVVSRCVVVRLGPVGRRDLRELVRSRARLAPEKERLIEEYAEGMAGWAVEMAEEEECLEEFEATLSEWAAVLEGGAVERVRLVEKLAPDRVAALDALNVLARYYAVSARRRWGTMKPGTADGSRSAAEVGGWVRNMAFIQRAMRALAANTLVRPTLEELLISVKAPGSPV